MYIMKPQQEVSFKLFWKN